MAIIKAYLKEPKSTSATPLFFMVSANGSRSKVYTSISVPPSHWLGQEQRLRTVFAPAEIKDKAERKRVAEDNESLNERLDAMRENLRVYHRDRLAAGHLPTVVELRAVVEPRQAAPFVIKATPQPLADFAAFIERARLTKQSATVKSFTTTLGHLTKFWASTPEARRGQSLTYDDLTVDFGSRFMAYLLNVVRLTDNSLAKQIDKTKQFLRDAVERGLTTNEAFSKWRWAKRESTIIALTAAELRQIEALELPEGHYLDNVRSLFLLSSESGLRFSDVAALRQEHDKGEFLRLTTQKTRQELVIPISPKARRILTELWAGKVRSISNQKFNVFIKELCKRSRIDAPTEWVSWRAGKREVESPPKWSLVSSHTGRKTYVSIAIELGVSLPALMRSTGHSDFKSLQRYIRLQDAHQRDEMRKMWNEDTEQI